MLMWFNRDFHRLFAVAAKHSHLWEFLLTNTKKLCTITLTLRFVDNREKVRPISLLQLVGFYEALP